MNQKQKFSAYLSSYGLSILHTSDSNITNPNDWQQNFITEAQTIDIIVDDAFPEIKQKLANLWRNNDIYSETKSKHVDSVSDGIAELWGVTYKTEKKSNDTFASLLKKYPIDGLKVSHNTDVEYTTINIRVDTKEAYIELLSEVLSILCV